MDLYSTEDFDTAITQCDTIEEFKKRILPQLNDQRTLWSAKIALILSEKNYSYADFAKLCKVSAAAVGKWKKGSLPQSRDMYMRIGFAAGYDRREMNDFLMRYGRCPGLYPKTLEDCVCIFVLGLNSNDATYETYERVLNLIRHEMQEIDYRRENAYTTGQLAEYVSLLKTKDEMVEFAKTFAPSFRQAYGKLYSFILAYLELNQGIDLAEDGREEMSTSFSAMAAESHWNASLYRCISEIKNKSWFPIRQKIISLGLHLNMDTYAINKMLQLAQMEQLYAKNPMEAAIMWAIGQYLKEDEIIPNGSADLCDFVKEILVRLEITEDYDHLIEDL